MTAAAPAARSDMRAWLWLAAAGLAVGAVIAADYWRDSRDSAVEPQAPLDPAELRAGPGPRTFTDALVNADREVAGTRANLEAHPGEWLRMEQWARALLTRHRLTGSAADLAEADRLLDRAMEIAPRPAGPSLSRAAVSLAIHDLLAAERALDRFDASAVTAQAERADARSMRCEIAFQRGQLATARDLCGGTEDLGTRMRRANIAAKTGGVDEAIQIVEALLRQPRLSPQTLATLALQRASLALAQGDWHGSGRWARAAERAFPGYWLSEAFVAQQYALEGNRGEAIRRYTILAARTGDPEVLDALTRLALAEGRAADAQRWASEAGDAWKQRFHFLPTSYNNHYAEHLLLNGNPRHAWVRVAGEYLRRPDSGTIAHYGYTLWRNGEHSQALELVLGGEATGFLTADLKLIEALALGSLGRAAEAGAALAEARRLNPRIDSVRQQFVTFGRD